MILDDILKKIIDIWKKNRTISTVMGMLSVACLGGYLIQVASGSLLTYLNTVFLCTIFLPLFLIPLSAEQDLIIYIKEKKRGNKVLKLEMVSNKGASFWKLIIFILVFVGIQMNIAILNPSAQIGVFKWLCIIEFAWTILLYVVSWIIRIYEKK